MSNRLLKAAVFNTPAITTKGLLDRLFALWFERFVYNQIWEDPSVDLEALQLDETSRVVTIASGGCNVLNYLLAGPKSIVAVDLNPAHIALTKLKLDLLPPVRGVRRPRQPRDLPDRPATASRRHDAGVLGAPHADRQAAHQPPGERPVSPRAARPLHRLPAFVRGAGRAQAVAPVAGAHAR
jgi:S-adenosylmethionine:diacylglycerol 3-amino-3-carboxypropyl transferase